MSCSSDPCNALLRECALYALGRIGRGDYSLVEPHLPLMQLLAEDAEQAARRAFIWTRENIVVISPTIILKEMSLLASLLNGGNHRNMSGEVRFLFGKSANKSV